MVSVHPDPQRSPKARGQRRWPLFPLNKVATPENRVNPSFIEGIGFSQTTSTITFSGVVLSGRERGSHQSCSRNRRPVRADTRSATRRRNQPGSLDRGGGTFVLLALPPRLGPHWPVKHGMGCASWAGPSPRRDPPSTCPEEISHALVPTTSGWDPGSSGPFRFAGKKTDTLPNDHATATRHEQHPRGGWPGGMAVILVRPWQLDPN
jgi:hypothetical protein